MLTKFGAEPLNNCSSIGFGRTVMEGLFQIANVSSTKQCDNPKSNKAMNGQACSEMVADVRESKKEFGEREVE